MPVDTFKALMEDRRLSLVFEHWLAARRDKPMPAWSQIDAVAIAPALPTVWAWRFDRSTNQFRGRLAGEEVLAKLRPRFRGRLLEEVFRPEVLGIVKARYCRIVDESACVHLRGSLLLSDRTEVLAERIMLPLAENGVDADGVFGVTIYRERIALHADDTITRQAPHSSIWLAVSDIPLAADPATG
jgi:hypothetical protein